MTQLLINGASSSHRRYRLCAWPHALTSGRSDRCTGRTHRPPSWERQPVAQGEGPGAVVVRGRCVRATHLRAGVSDRSKADSVVVDHINGGSIAKSGRGPDRTDGPGSPGAQRSTLVLLCADCGSSEVASASARQRLWQRPTMRCTSPVVLVIRLLSVTRARVPAQTASRISGDHLVSDRAVSSATTLDKPFHLILPRCSSARWSGRVRPIRGCLVDRARRARRPGNVDVDVYRTQTLARLAGASPPWRTLPYRTALPRDRASVTSDCFVSSAAARRGVLDPCLDRVDAQVCGVACGDGQADLLAMDRSQFSNRGVPHAAGRCRHIGQSGGAKEDRCGRWFQRLNNITPHDRKWAPRGPEGIALVAEQGSRSASWTMASWLTDWRRADRGCRGARRCGLRRLTGLTRPPCVGTCVIAISLVRGPIMPFLERARGQICPARSLSTTSISILTARFYLWSTTRDSSRRIRRGR